MEKSQSKLTQRIDAFRFWARSDWRMAKTILIMLLISGVVFSPLIYFGLTTDWEAVRNTPIVSAYAIIAFILGANLFYWLCFANLPPRINE